MASTNFDDFEIRNVGVLPYQALDSNDFRGSFNFFPAKYMKENGEKEDCWVEREFLDTFDEAEIPGIIRRSKREVGILRLLSKIDHVVQCIDIFKTERSIHRIYEKQLPSYSAHYCYFSKDSLNSFSQSVEGIRSIMYQLLTVLDHCHSKQIVHGQIQPKSMLVIPIKDDKSEDTYHLKLTNFDRAHNFYQKDPLPHNYHKCCSTLWFDAPEILLSEEYSRDFLKGGETDMWAVGVTLAHLSINNHPLFPGTCEIDTLFKIFRQLGTPHVTNAWPDACKLPHYNKAFPNWNAIAFPKKIRDKLHEEGCNMLQKLLSLDPQKRPTAKECMGHAYFKEVGDNKSRT